MRDKMRFWRVLLTRSKGLIIFTRFAETGGAASWRRLQFQKQSLLPKAYLPISSFRGMSDITKESCDTVIKSCDSSEESHGVSCDAAGNDNVGVGSTEESNTPAEPFSYFQRGFTTEIFKIEVNNIPQHVGYQQLKKQFKSLKLSPVKIKKPGKTFCFVTFRCEEDRQAALQAINGYVWKKRTLSAKIAAPAVDPLFRRKKKALQDSDEEGGEMAKRKCKESILEMSLEEKLADAVTPLLKTPYPEQLALKQEAMAKCLKDTALRMSQPSSNPNEWFEDHVKQHGGMMCALEPIRPSPVQTEYRNKCEFSVGVSADGKPVVGFRLASYEDGDFTVVSADTCVHISQQMKDLAKGFQEYFSESSLPPLNALTETGHWRQVAIRCYSTGESMAVVQLHPQDLSQEQLTEEKQKLTDFFKTGKDSEKSGYAPTSLYFQLMGRKVSGYSSPCDLLLGAEHIYESLLGLKFRISPDSFFQVNTAATEVLYSLVQEEVSATAAKKYTPTTIYDICCGTGSIGLYLAKTLRASRVVGVEMVEQAVEDAQFNAKLNGVSGAEFLCGKAEDVMPGRLDLPVAGLGEVIGVVDPPRNGLHPKVIQTIRKCSAIQKLVYVSCNPTGAQQNFVNLCRKQSNKMKGAPFRPVHATPVDLFPHTKHCELVVLFERYSEKQSEREPTQEDGEDVVDSTEITIKTKLVVNEI